MVQTSDRTVISDIEVEAVVSKGRHSFQLGRACAASAALFCLVNFECFTCLIFLSSFFFLGSDHDTHVIPSHRLQLFNHSMIRKSMFQLTFTWHKIWRLKLLIYHLLWCINFIHLDLLPFLPQYFLDWNFSHAFLDKPSSCPHAPLLSH